MRNQRNFYTRVVTTRLESTEEEQESTKKEDGVVIPDVIFCNTLINAYAKLGDYKLAQSILNAMVFGGDVEAGIPPTEPTMVTYNTLADACKVVGELGAALEVPELMVAHAEAWGIHHYCPTHGRTQFAFLPWPGSHGIAGDVGTCAVAVRRIQIRHVRCYIV